MKFEDLTGKKFNNLTPIRYIRGFKISSDKKLRGVWECLCICGNKTLVKPQKLKSGIIKSCGCLSKEHMVKHSKSRSRFYNIWRGIKCRCLNKNHHSYRYYGMIGIKICDSWLEFNNFYNDMYDSYLEHVKYYGEKNTTIDRVDNNGDYCKNNCRWATMRKQYENRVAIRDDFGKFK